MEPMPNPKSDGETAESTLDKSKKRNHGSDSEDHADGYKKRSTLNKSDGVEPEESKSDGINESDRPKFKTKKRIQKSKNIIDEDEKFDQKNEIIELSRSVKELTEAVKSLPEILLTMLKDRETTPEIEEEEEERHPGCHLRRLPKNPCIDCQQVGHHNNDTILVLGLDELTLPRHQVKDMLRILFSSCGEITRLSVPINYNTCSPVGFAFVDLKNGQGTEKALELDSYELEGVKLEVTLAQNRGISQTYAGCERCMSEASARRAPALHPELVVQPFKKTRSLKRWLC